MKQKESKTNKHYGNIEPWRITYIYLNTNIFSFLGSEAQIKIIQKFTEQLVRHYKREKKRSEPRIRR